MIQLISYGLVFVASFFNAVMDACENSVKFNQSILRKLPKQFWLKEESWKYAPKLFSYKFDSWHIAKSCMIICFILAILFYKQENSWIVELCIHGAVWNFGFWLNYHKILGVK